MARRPADFEVGEVVLAKSRPVLDQAPDPLQRGNRARIGRPNVLAGGNRKVCPFAHAGYVRKRFGSVKGIVAVQKNVKRVVPYGICEYEFAIMRPAVATVLPVSPNTEITTHHAFFFTVT